MSNNNNLFLYWTGIEPNIIKILRNIIYLHSNNGDGYKIHLINDSNINHYIKNIPSKFHSLGFAQKADFVRVNVICDNGGIWLDSDTVILDSMDVMFNYLKDKNGFIIKEQNWKPCNGVFGSRANTRLMIDWKNEINRILCSDEKIEWENFGAGILMSFEKNKSVDYFKEYEIIMGLDNIYPVNWHEAYEKYLLEPYDYYKKIIRKFQPFIILVHSVYRAISDITINELLTDTYPLNYFIKKSFQNMKHLVNYDFIEIGTCNYNTLIENSDDETIGISIDPVKYYLDQLPNKKKVNKYNIGISDKDSDAENVYYIPDKIIQSLKLKTWLKGCNTLYTFHPRHIDHNLEQFCTVEKVKVMTPKTLLIENNVKNNKLLKINTEGHDCVILHSLYEFIKNLPNYFLPNKIVFQTNELTKKEDIDNIILKYQSLKYNIEYRNNYITSLILDLNIKIDIHSNIDTIKNEFILKDKNYFEKTKILNILIQPDNNILEIGAKYGELSCIVDRKIGLNKKCIVVDKNVQYINILKQNKHINNCNFYIIHGEISRNNETTLEKIKQIIPLSHINILIITSFNLLEILLNACNLLYKYLHIIIIKSTNIDKPEHQLIISNLTKNRFNEKLKNPLNIWMK